MLFDLILLLFILNTARIRIKYCIITCFMMYMLSDTDCNASVAHSYC